MGSEIFREGGEHNIRRVGRDQYEMSINLPVGEDGMFGRACGNSGCSPGEFRVKPGTGITSGQAEAYCPYCRFATDPNDFATEEQLRFAKELVRNEAIKGVRNQIRESLGLDSSGRKRFGGGMISMDMELTPSRAPAVRRPFEEELRHELACPDCGLEHAVFGLAFWCPDCGSDIFTTHVESESNVIRALLKEVELRFEDLDRRVAGRCVENCLEDVASMMEASLKALVRRRLAADGLSENEIDDRFRRIVRARMQGVNGISQVFDELFSITIPSLADSSIAGPLQTALDKRHPITHNLGIADQKYLERATSGSRGRDVSVTKDEVLAALDRAMVVIGDAHRILFLI